MQYVARHRDASRDDRRCGSLHAAGAPWQRNAADSRMDCGFCTPALFGLVFPPRLMHSS